MSTARFATALALAGFTLFHASATLAQQVDPTLLNIQSQGGSVLNISASSRQQGIDDPTEAVGNPTGPVEPGTFIFADNGNGGQESMTLNLAFPGVTLTGVRITGGGVGAGAGDPRTISTVLVAGSLGLEPSHTLGQIADFDDPAGFSDILFAVPQHVDQIIIQFGTPEQGARITEIDAIVPEPASAGLVLFAGGALITRCRRRRSDA
jgi:hypothetical protein